MKQGILKALCLDRTTVANTHGKFLVIKLSALREPMLNWVA